MAVLATIYKHTVGRVLPSTMSFTQTKPNFKKRKFEDSEISNDPRNSTSRRRRRETSQEEEHVITKKRRVDADHFAPIVDGQTYEATAIEAPCMSEQTPQKPDRFLMPPPALVTTNYRVSLRMEEDDSVLSSADLEGQSQLSVGTRGTQARTSEEFNNDYDMERARRHAAATTLPTNSGVWERGEKELFYHLSYRGFEPLLPRNWMTDFQTLPLSVYQPENDDQAPLIQVYKRRAEFRAIRELRELLELGKNVRDRVLVSPGIRREAMIEKAVKKYFDWALNDAGIKTHSASAAKSRHHLQVHVIVRLKPHQSTADCLSELKMKMHALRTRHCQARNIHASVEREEVDYQPADTTGDGTWIAEDTDEDLPVIYGVAIVSSLLLVCTLNSRTPAPRSATSASHVLSPAGSSSRDSTQQVVETEDDTASDPRFLSEFDFSDPSKDVWNALVIAIIAMQIRRDILLLIEQAGEHELIEDVVAGIEDTSVMDLEDDDPDA